MVEKVFTETTFKGYSSNDKLRPNTEITDIELVKRDLLNHIYTRQGERLMRPEYGSIIWDLLFEQFTEVIRDAVVADITRIVSTDPRTVVQSIDVLEFEHGIRIDVALLFQPFAVVDTFSASFDRRNDIQSISDFDDTF